MTYVLSTIANSKIIIVIFTLKENEDICKASFLVLSIAVHDRKCTTELFDKKMSFPFISIAYRIWIAIYYLGYFVLQLVLKFYLFPGQQEI